MRWAAQVDALSEDLWQRAASASRPGPARGPAEDPPPPLTSLAGRPRLATRAGQHRDGPPADRATGTAVIGKICPRGDDLAGLIRYLYGPGRGEEHTDPHIVAGYRDPAGLEPGLRSDGRRDFRRLVHRLRLPHDRQGSYAWAKPVWHCPVRAAPEDRMLSDAEWAQIAQDVMARTGLSPHGQDDQGVRWIAVRHGPDHIHLVAMLARQDGARVSTWNTRYRVRDACIAAEQRYGLRSTAPADRTASRGPTRAETGKAERLGLGEPPRVTLLRHVATAAAAAASAEEFFARLGQAGVQVRVRYSTKNPGQVTGYSVALPGDTSRDGTAVWYGGGKLAADLSWPRLAQRWAAGQQPVPHLRIEERQQLSGVRRQRRRSCRRPDPRLVPHQPRGCCRRRVGGRGRAADHRRRARQPHPAPSRRRIRPRRPRAVRAHPAAHPGREPAPPGRPAHLRLRVPHPRQVVRAAETDRPARRARRGNRSAAPGTAARPPGPGRAPRRHRAPRSQRDSPASTTRHRHRARTATASPGRPGHRPDRRPDRR